MKSPTFHPPIRRALATAEGTFIAEYTARGLACLDFPTGTAAPADGAADFAVPTVHEWHTLTTRAVHTALAGKTPTQLPPLDLARGTAFQQSVWRELQTIAAGQTRSYGEVAAALGRPKASRAVGGACGANPLPLLIPCHRVLAAAGGLGGFSGGLQWKRRLLQAEGTLPPARLERRLQACERSQRSQRVPPVRR